MKWSWYLIHGDFFANEMYYVRGRQPSTKRHSSCEILLCCVWQSFSASKNIMISFSLEGTFWIACICVVSTLLSRNFLGNNIVMIFFIWFFRNVEDDEKYNIFHNQLWLIPSVWCMCDVSLTHFPFNAIYILHQLKLLSDHKSVHLWKKQQKIVFNCSV